jgi:DNA-binding CsgD family transcriptional regulator
MSGLVTIEALKAPQRLHAVIDAIGESDFEQELLGFLNQTFGAEHCAVFGLDGARPSEMSAVSLDGTDTAHRRASLYLTTELWRRDPTMDAARDPLDSDQPKLIRLDIGALEDRELRDTIYSRMGERLLLCGRSLVGRIGLSIVRSEHQALPTRNLPELQDLGALLLSILGKHASASWHRRKLLLALTSLEEIETWVAASPERFPHREVQVCARMLYGVSSIGIALELGISEETVLTYRKRIYHRLSIGTQRELLIWYVSRWSKGAVDPVLAPVPQRLVRQ